MYTGALIVEFMITLYTGLLNDIRCTTTTTTTAAAAGAAAAAATENP